MKVGDLVFSHGKIAIIVGECGRPNHVGVVKEKQFFRIYYFELGRFSNSHKWSLVPRSR